MANKDKVKNKEEPLETVKELKLSELVPFKNHPFKVRDDEDMEKTVESIRDTDAVMRRSLQALKRFLQSSGILMMMRQQFLWSIATCKGRRYCRVREHGR